jgi:hypothetical protein
MEWSKKLTVFISALIVLTLAAHFYILARYGQDATSVTLAVLGFGSLSYGAYFTKAGVENFQKIKKVGEFAESVLTADKEDCE